MQYESDNVDGTDMEQIKIVLNTLYLCIDFAMKHIETNEGARAAVEFKEKMLSALKSGDINMALMEDTRTFDLVVTKIEGLASPIETTQAH